MAKNTLPKVKPPKDKPNPKHDATITGTATGAATEDDDLTANGLLTVSDPDKKENIFQDPSPESLIGVYGSFTFNAITGAWGYTLNNGALNVQALAVGVAVHDTLTVASLDGSASKVIDVTVVGKNDAPIIEGGDNPLLFTKVEDEFPSFVKFQAIATDVDLTDTLSWSIDGGTLVNADFRFFVDELKITKTINGTPTVIVHDTFSDHLSPGFADGPNGSKVFWGSDGSTGEGAGRVTLIGPMALEPTPDAGTGVLAARAGETLLTNIDPATDFGLKDGVRDGADFVVEARFDLVLPDDVGERFGLRLNDRDGAAPGNDQIAIILERSADAGNPVKVMLRDTDFTANTSTTLEQIALNALPGDDQIVFRLSHDHDERGVVHAQFELWDNGSLRSTTDFNMTGQIFNGENWTRASIFAASPVETVSNFAGTYTRLTVDQDGNVMGSVRNGRPEVQALAAGETVTENYTLRVSDGHGGTDTQIISITVVGVDEPSMLLV